MRALRTLLAVLTAAVPLVAAGQTAPDGRRLAPGGRIAVAGRVVAASGEVGDGADAFYVQSAARGLRVVPRAGGPPVARGDSVVVSGVLAERHGQASLGDAAVQRVPVAPSEPAPRPVEAGAFEAAEGRLVRAVGRVVALSHVTAGTALTLALDGGGTLVVFAFAERRPPLSLDGYEPGDRLRVTGVLGQFDREAPFDEGYQLYPRRAADVARAGVPPSAYRAGALVALGLLAAALAWAAALRRQVRRRVDELRRTEARYRRLVARASDGVWVHGLGGDVSEMNDAAWRAAGRAPAGVCPPLGALVAPESASALADHLAAVAARGTSRTDLVLRRPDGRAVEIEMESSRIEIDGEVRVLSLGRDVGARRAHERSLDAARVLAEETAHAKSAFLATMSHEIRTPLTAVIGFAELLREEVPEAQADLAEAVSSASQRLLATLNSVLDVARLDADGAALGRDPLDLVAHLAEATAMLRALADRKGLALTFAADRDAWPVYADGGALDRVLTNLAGNAIKFTETGGVDVRLEAGPDGQAVLTVTDTGPGMDAGFLPYVFDEFRQERGAASGQTAGSGLGLALTRRLVEQMGGEIAVESQKGAGSRFTVTWPTLAVAPAPVEA